MSLSAAGPDGDTEGSAVSRRKSPSVQRKTVPATSEATSRDCSDTYPEPGDTGIGTVVPPPPWSGLKTHKPDPWKFQGIQIRQCRCATSQRPSGKPPLGS